MEAMKNLTKILKAKKITKATKFGLVDILVLSVFLYGCEICTCKASYVKRIDDWRRMLFIPWVKKEQVP